MTAAVTRLRTFSKSLAALLTVCFVVLFAAAPLAESLTCGGEESVAAVAHADAVASSDHHSGKAGDPDLGVGSCVHGHCHHSPFAAATPDVAAGQATAPKRAALPPAGVRLASADLAHDKPPPRA